MTGHGLGEDGFVRPAAYNTGAAQLWTPPEAGLQLSSRCSLWAAPAASPYLIREGRTLSSYLGFEGPGRRKTMVLRGFVRGGKEFPPSSGPLILKRGWWAGPWLQRPLPGREAEAMAFGTKAAWSRAVPCSPTPNCSLLVPPCSRHPLPQRQTVPDSRPPWQVPRNWAVCPRHGADTNTACY